MTRIIFVITAILFFLLGFIVNEFRHAKILSDLNRSTTQNTTQSTTQSFQNTGHISDAIKSQPAAPDNKQAPVDINQTSRQQPVVFSWSHTDQLITQGNFKEAIQRLKDHQSSQGESSQLWFYLAKAYEKQGEHKLSLEAWFRYLDYETNAEHIYQAIVYIKNYLMRLKQTPSLYGQDTFWLIDQFNKLLELSPNDGELHLMLAALYIDAQDNYQAQYHALMAANDPSAQARAENILAQLNGTKVPDNLTIPLRPFGNQYLVEVMVEGHKARLLLDTGASLSGLSNSFTDKHPALVKATKPIRLSTAGGDVDSYLFTVTRLDIESLQFNQHILALLPMGNSNQFDGLLGVDILGRFDFVIDREASVLRLRRRK